MARDIVISRDFETGAYENLTVSSSPVGFTTTKILPTSGDYAGMPCQEVFLTIDEDDDDISFITDPDSVVSSSVGSKLYKGQNLILRNPKDIKNFRAIRITTDVTLRCHFRFAKVA